MNDDQRLMTEGKRPPTPHASVNAFVAELLRRLNTQLGDELLGLYVDGSLALGDFDEHSDVDFVAVTRRPIAQQAFERLQTMHDELARLDSPTLFWKLQLSHRHSRRTSDRGWPATGLSVLWPLGVWRQRLVRKTALVARGLPRREKPFGPIA